MVADVVERPAQPAKGTDVGLDRKRVMGALRQCLECGDAVSVVMEKWNGVMWDAIEVAGLIIAVTDSYALLLADGSTGLMVVVNYETLRHINVWERSGMEWGFGLAPWEWNMYKRRAP